MYTEARIAKLESRPMARRRSANAARVDESRQHYCLFETDLGVCGIAWGEHGLTRLGLPEADRASTENRLRGDPPVREPAAPPAQIQSVIAAIQRHLAGHKVDYSAVRLDLSRVGDFYARTYDALRSVGWGETASYGELARRIGSPGAARGVGQAMGRNPLPIIIPCHRVLASGNKPGGFSAFGGAATKQRLLALEGVRLGADADAPLLHGLLPKG